MSNHDSFLKILGLDEQGAQEKPSEENSQSTQSETEWDVGAANPLVSDEPEAPSDPIWDVPAADSFESPPAATPVEVEAVDMNRQEMSEWSSTSSGSQTGELDLEFNERLTRTERMEASIRAEETALYTKEEVERVEAEPIRGLTFTGTQKTQETVPFEYNKSGASRVSAMTSAEGTAHFDYSKQQGDQRIVVLEGRVNSQAFHLSQLPLRMGRDPQNEVVLDDANASRFHAEIRGSDGQVIVVDLDSTNGVKVNGSLIVSEQVLQSHDIVQVGDCLFEFLDAGALSKGEPLRAVVAEGQSGVVRVPRRKRKAMVIAASAVSLLVVGLLILRNSDLLQEAARQGAIEVFVDQSVEEINALRSMMEKTYGKSIGMIDSQEVKTAFIERFEAKGLFALAPGSKEMADKLPAALIHLFVIDTDVYSESMRGGATQEVVAYVLSNRLNSLIASKDFVAALKVSEILMMLRGDDKSVQKAYQNLKVVVGQSADTASSSVSRVEQDFYGYMEQQENIIIRMIDEGKEEEAIKFSDEIVHKLNYVASVEPSYEKLALEESARWTDRRNSLGEKLEARESKRKKAQAVMQEGEELFEKIQEAFDSNQLAEAKKLIEKFNEDFANHDRWSEVQELSAQMDQIVSRTFEATQSSVKGLMEQEGYEAAWKEFYRFRELMPPYPPADKLKAELSKLADGRAAQLYNQARVFEFEADDLVAAEQFYKKTLEFADPESELYQKAKRRFEDVKRKGLR